MSSTVVPEALRARIRERFTPNLYISYGTNETGTVTLAGPELVGAVPGIVGHLIPGMEAEIIDGAGNRLDPGEEGRLRVRSAGMVTGYLNDGEATARAFLDGCFDTGDLAVFTDGGALIHKGRADDMMIYDGINIYPGEIENALLNHLVVAEVAAFSLRSSELGDIPFAAVVIKSQASEEDLISHCRSWLGAHAPAGIMIVPKLPRNAVGKV